MTEAQQTEFLEHLRNGIRRGAAGYAMGLDRMTVMDFIAAEGNEEFAKAVLDAEGEAHEHVDEAVWQAAVSGSVAAARLWYSLQKRSESQLPVVYEGEPDDDDELEAIARLTTE